jgi:hypothetical protein
VVDVHSTSSSPKQAGARLSSRVDNMSMCTDRNLRVKCQRGDHWFCAVARCEEQTPSTKTAPTRIEICLVKAVPARRSREREEVCVMFWTATSTLDIGSRYKEALTPHASSSRSLRRPAGNTLCGQKQATRSRGESRAYSLSYRCWRAASRNKTENKHT